MINEIRAANGKNALFWNSKVYEDSFILIFNYIYIS